ncbi:MAG: 4-hydroxy-3-methylbut-2-enyl diphosphate reductase [Planctomycetia bacterium]|jgi:4-hydroxy-3-methylbut-2-enyl diphosphate reductase
MRILLAAPRGFCAGVNMAIESLELAVRRFEAPIYVFHEIVHNRWVVERFRKMGVIFVDRIEEIPLGSHVLYSAHGVSPEVRQAAEARRLQVVDATCPLVTRVHREAIRLASEGYTVILIGHRGHDEVVGVLGEAPEAIRLVGSVDEAETVEVDDPDRVAYLTQTTLSVVDACQIIDRLRERFPSIVAPKGRDICYATQNRQEAVMQLAQEADFGLVVGSQNSSNSRRLAEIFGTCGVPALLIDGPSEIHPEQFTGSETVVITAGASAPENVVQDCIAMLQYHFNASLETRTICVEDICFSLPKELREDKKLP